VGLGFGTKILCRFVNPEQLDERHYALAEKC